MGYLMKGKQYQIFIKGWGAYEMGWYPHAIGNSIEEVKQKVFAECENKHAEYRVVIENTLTVVEEGTYKEGVCNNG